jgi:tRNA-guanine family transglycosylase
LYNAYYLYKRFRNYYHDFLKIIQFPTNYLFILDSGGYELFSRQEKNDKEHQRIVKALTPERVLAMAEAIANICMILDQPPYEDVYLNCSDAYFQKALDFTDKSTEIMLKNRKSSTLKLYGVLQGKELYQLMLWWAVMKKYQVGVNGYKVDGWAVAPKPMGNIEKVMMYILFILIEEINVPIHFLGVGNNDALALIIYFSKYYPHLVTADSSSYNNEAKLGRGIMASLNKLRQQKIYIETLIALIENPEEYKKYVLARCNRQNYFKLKEYFRLIEIIARRRKKILLT